MMKPLYKLKWLSGILAGRELALPLGEIRLGEKHLISPYH